MTKRADSLEALRNMDAQQLEEHMREQRRRLFTLRFEQATGQVEDHRQIRLLHKEIARAMTVQIEAQRAPESEEE